MAAFFFNHRKRKQFLRMTDVVGRAQSDYFHDQFRDALWVQIKMPHWLDGLKRDNNDFYYSPIQKLPVEIYFRNPDNMPELEQKALGACRGKILDIGAGTGSHCLVLQRMGHDVTALDISSSSTALMKERGVRTVLMADFFRLPKACTIRFS
jgi:2-polyprenyl-3-methyl-5-hydroxy-6-metoxy-1,4-benzoquinol methylase